MGQVSTNNGHTGATRFRKSNSTVKQEAVVQLRTDMYQVPGSLVRRHTRAGCSLLAGDSFIGCFIGESDIQQIAGRAVKIRIQSANADN